MAVRCEQCDHMADEFFMYRDRNGIHMKLCKPCRDQIASHYSSGIRLKHPLDNAAKDLWAISLKRIFGQRAGEGMFSHLKGLEAVADHQKGEIDRLYALYSETRREVAKREVPRNPVLPVASKCECCGTSVEYSLGQKRNLCRACLKKAAYPRRMAWWRWLLFAGGLVGAAATGWQVYLLYTSSL